MAKRNKSKQSGGGRPKYSPTEADRATVRNMAAAGIPQHNICQCLGTEGIAEKTLRKHFSHELATSPYMVTGFAMSKLFAAIQSNEAWAICFWMKTKAGFQETQGHRFIGQDGKDRGLTLEAVRAYMNSIPDPE